MDLEGLFSERLRMSSAEAEADASATWIVEKFMRGFTEHRERVPAERATHAYAQLAAAIEDDAAAWSDLMYRRLQRYDRVVATAWLGAVSEGLREQGLDGAADVCWRLRRRLLGESESSAP